MDHVVLAETLAKALVVVGIPRLIGRVEEIDGDANLALFEDVASVVPSIVALEPKVILKSVWNDQVIEILDNLLDFV